MDATRAKELLAGLADGVNPLTGEILSLDCICNQADIKNALNFAVEALKKDLQLPTDGVWHKEFGRIWSSEETEKLCGEFDARMPVNEIAKRHERTETAIRAKLVRAGKISNRHDI